MRCYAIVLSVVLSLGASAFAEDTVQLSKSNYFDQQVTAEDKGDHYLIHFNVAVKLERPLNDGETRLLHASVLFSRGEAISDVSKQERHVTITKQNEIWSFYFRTPKFATDPNKTMYAVVARVDGANREAAAVWKFSGGSIDMGSSDQPIVYYYPVGRQIEQEDDMGGFRLVVVYEVKSYTNNYDALPELGLLKAGKRMPTVIDGSRSAKRLEP